MTECLQQEKWIKVCKWLIIWWTKVWKLVLCRAPLQLPSRFSCVDPSTPSQHHQPNNFQNIFWCSKYLASFQISCNFQIYFKIAFTSSQHHQRHNFQSIFQFSHMSRNQGCTSWQPFGEDKIGHEIFVKCVIAIFATNVSFLRVIANLQS